MKNISLWPACHTFFFLSSNWKHFQTFPTPVCFIGSPRFYFFPIKMSLWAKMVISGKNIAKGKGESRKICNLWVKVRLVVHVHSGASMREMEVGQAGGMWMPAALPMGLHCVLVGRLPPQRPAPKIPAWQFYPLQVPHMTAHQRDKGNVMIFLLL